MTGEKDANRAAFPWAAEFVDAMRAEFGPDVMVASIHARDGTVLRGLAPEPYLTIPPAPAEIERCRITGFCQSPRHCKGKSCRP